MEIRREQPIPDKLPEELTNKTFVATVASIVADWRLYLKEWRAELEMLKQEVPYLRRGPSEDVDLRTLKDGESMSALQREVVRDLVSMLTQTAFNWENKSVLKGEGQLIKAVAPLILAKKHTEALLATDAGWSMRCGIGRIMQQILPDGWHAWDGFDSKPKSEVPMDKQILVTQAKGEGSSSVATRTRLIPQLREQHTAALQKVVDAVMVDSLGIIGRDPISGQGVADPRVHAMVSEFILASPIIFSHAPTRAHLTSQRMQFFADKRAARMDDPALGQRFSFQDKVTDADLEALEEDYPVKIPNAASEEHTDGFWRAKDAAETGQVIRSLLALPANSMDAWERERRATKAAAEKEERETKAIEKISLFGRSRRRASALSRQQKVDQLTAEAEMLTLADQDQGESSRQTNKRASAYFIAAAEAPITAEGKGKGKEREREPEPQRMVVDEPGRSIRCINKRASAYFISPPATAPIATTAKDKGEEREKEPESQQMVVDEPGRCL